jgi:predicted PP-loop superfamily ATPase
LLLGIACFSIFILQTFFNDLLSKFGFGFTDVEIEVDENLPNFFNAVKLSEREFITKENSYYKANYAMPLLSDSLAQ